jgi:hypothetical protein
MVLNELCVSASSGQSSPYLLTVSLSTFPEGVFLGFKTSKHTVSKTVSTRFCAALPMQKDSADTALTAEQILREY